MTVSMYDIPDNLLRLREENGFYVPCDTQTARVLETFECSEFDKVSARYVAAGYFFQIYGSIKCASNGISCKKRISKRGAKSFVTNPCLHCSWKTVCDKEICMQGVKMFN